MSRQARVSLGLPVYNGSRFLRDSVDSILEQTYSDFELIICDNASTDGTEALCRAYAEKDSRIRYIRNKENLGAARNFNESFHLANGEYFKWVAHDDVCKPGFLAATVAALDQNPSCVLACTGVEFIDEESQVVRVYDTDLFSIEDDDVVARFRDLASLHHWCFDIFGLTRRERLSETSLIGPYVNSDRNLLAELALVGKFYRVPERLFQSREHRNRSIRMTELHDRAGWFDPRLANDVTFPHWRNLIEYFFSVNRVPMSHSARLRCYGTLVHWSLRFRKRLFIDVVRAWGRFRRIGNAAL